VPVGKTKFHELLSDGRFPAPAIKSPRFTAWDSRVVNDWIERQIQIGGADLVGSEVSP